MFLRSDCVRTEDTPPTHLQASRDSGDLGVPTPKIAPLGGLPSGPYPKTSFVKSGQNRGTEGRPRFSPIFHQSKWVIRGSKKALEPVASRHYVYIKASHFFGASYTPLGCNFRQKLTLLESPPGSLLRRASLAETLLSCSCSSMSSLRRRGTHPLRGWSRSSPLVTSPLQCFPPPSVSH